MWTREIDLSVLLKALNISCEKSDRLLFQHIDLSVAAGEIVLLKGENGAGKTSLLRILLGLSHPSSGQVFVNNINIHQDINAASQFVCYVGHKSANNALFSPLENLQCFCEVKGYKKVSNDDLIQLLSEFQLEGLEDLPFKHLSAGQQRRVSLAKLFLDPKAKLWVLDEPFTSLDVQTIDFLEKKIKYFVDAGGAVLMTSHQAFSLEKESRVVELDYQW